MSVLTSVQRPTVSTDDPTTSVSLGDLISLFYEEYLLLLYGDEELAALAAATTVNELLDASTELPEA